MPRDAKTRTEVDKPTSGPSKESIKQAAVAPRSTGSVGRHQPERASGHSLTKDSHSSTQKLKRAASKSSVTEKRPTAQLQKTTSATLNSQNYSTTASTQSKPPLKQAKDQSKPPRRDLAPPKGTTAAQAISGLPPTTKGKQPSLRKQNSLGRACKDQKSKEQPVLKKAQVLKAMHNIQQIGQEKEAKPTVAAANRGPTPDPEKKDDADENKVSEQPPSKQQPKAQPDQ